MAEAPVRFADLLRQLRTQSQLTQEELAGAASLSRRAVSDLERGVATIPQRNTVRLLADALRLIGPARAEFEAAARGRPQSNGRGPAPALRSLPRDVATFTGRQRELQRLGAAAVTAGGVAGVHVIGGMAGVGKTAFAVHAAHHLAPRFPDGQMFLLLNGHTPGRRPVDPADALAGLLLTAGVPAAQIPPGLEPRMALWRDRVAGKRLLLLLDDAESTEQVRPLLPGTPESLVLVTSRRHLSALDDATAITLDALPPDQAAVLLVRLAGRAGLSPAEPAVAEITRLCGYLPLALGMVARQLSHHPAWTVVGRAAELAAARDRLGLMATENLSVAAAFDLSYADLDQGQQRLFRGLGLHPGADIDVYAAAALDRTDLDVARRGLEALYDQYLLTEPRQGRYRLHDLVREHARALANRVDQERDSEAATTRLLDYYQDTAARANALIVRQASPALTIAVGQTHAATPSFSDPDEALAWARAERVSLLACLDRAASTGRHAHVVTLTAGIAGLLRRDGPWTEAISRHASALEAARHLGNRLGEANVLNDLGDTQRLTGEYAAAERSLEQALDIYRDLGERLGQANALNDLASAQRLRADYPAATRSLEEALEIYRHLGDRRGQANALVQLGAVRPGYPAAAGALQEALEIYRDLGDRRGQANTLNFLGAVASLADDYPAAVQAQSQALEICRELGDRLGQAHTLRGLGTLRQKTGDYRAAEELLEHALDIYSDLGARNGEADALHGLGIVRRLSGNYQAADLTLQQALGMYISLGARAGEALALHDLGVVRRLTDDHAAAVEALEKALRIFRDIGLRESETRTLNELGTLARITGELALAEKCHRQALELARAVGGSASQAAALAGLARCALAAGDGASAMTLLRQAHEIFQRIGAAEALDIQGELDALSGLRSA